VTVVTGVSAHAYIADFARRLAEQTGVRIDVVAVPNRLFGEQVTVTGLVTGGDIIAALTDYPLSPVLVVPDVMLKEGEGIFLDDRSPADLADALGCRVIVVSATPAGLYEALVDLQAEN
jgi:NifB/MoaA-like Fe-S oxidoreductase